MNALSSLWWQIYDCCHLVRLFRIFCNCFYLSLLQGPLQCTKKMVCLGLANVIQCQWCSQPVAAYASNRCVLNIQVYSFCYEASLIETIAIFCADLRSCNRVYFTQQLYSRISNARSELSMIKEPMFLSGVRTYCTGQRTPIKCFLEYI